VQYSGKRLERDSRYKSEITLEIRGSVFVGICLNVNFLRERDRCETGRRGYMRGVFEDGDVEMDKNKRENRN
jgi:hypothetical protein